MECVLGPIRFIFPSSELDELHLFLFFPLDFCAMFSPVDASHFICDSLIRECSARCERRLFHTTYMLKEKRNSLFYFVHDTLIFLFFFCFFLKQK